MRFPIAVLKPYDPIIYVYSCENDFRKTSEEILKQNPWDKCKIIDSNGEQYSVLNVKKIRSRGIYGWHPLLKGKSILIEFKFSEGEKVDIDTFKKNIICRFEKDNNFWKATWSINELKNTVTTAKNFKELILLFQ